MEFQSSLTQPRARKSQEFGGVTRRRLLGNEFVGCLNAKLRLGGSSRGAATKPSQFLSDQVVASSGFGICLTHAFGFSQHERRVPAVIVLNSTVDYFPGVVGDSIEEPTVVGDDDEAKVATNPQVLGQPRNSLNVQVVRGLVEQQQIQRLNQASS
ncbi:unannotated protein [freshwater metagenome]|uniref:Unannotated protein n=1 Tax=freshwater metagenome TaxID=449393 RepID=A0A6J6W4K7_9ZZZZ